MQRSAKRRAGSGSLPGSPSSWAARPTSAPSRVSSKVQLAPPEALVPTSASAASSSSCKPAPLRGHAA
eukprot:3495332-Alexandrium_andersonii.AAC.1